MSRNTPTAAPANRLCELRTANGLPLEAIAQACGVHASTVLRWQAPGLIPQAHLVTVAGLLDVTVPVLAGWEPVETERAA